MAIASVLIGLLATTASVVYVPTAVDTVVEFRDMFPAGSMTGCEWNDRLESMDSKHPKSKLALFVNDGSFAPKCISPKPPAPLTTRKTYLFESFLNTAEEYKVHGILRAVGFQFLTLIVHGAIETRTWPVLEWSEEKEKIILPWTEGFSRKYFPEYVIQAMENKFVKEVLVEANGDPLSQPAETEILESNEVALLYMQWRIESELTSFSDELPGKETSWLERIAGEIRSRATVVGFQLTHWYISMEDKDVADLQANGLLVIKVLAGSLLLYLAYKVAVVFIPHDTIQAFLDCFLRYTLMALFYLNVRSPHVLTMLADSSPFDATFMAGVMATFGLLSCVDLPDQSRAKICLSTMPLYLVGQHMEVLAQAWNVECAFIFHASLWVGGLICLYLIVLRVQKSTVVRRALASVLRWMRATAGHARPWCNLPSLLLVAEVVFWTNFFLVFRKRLIEEAMED